MRGEPFAVAVAGLLAGLLIGSGGVAGVWLLRSAPDTAIVRPSTATTSTDRRFKATLTEVSYSHGAARTALTVTDTTTGDWLTLELPAGPADLQWTAARTVLLELPLVSVTVELGVPDAKAL